MRIVFAGSPDFAVPALEKLLNNGKNVVAVVTQPDRPTGRKKVLTPTPVKSFALVHSLAVYDFEKIRDNVGTLKELGADIMITCAYGQILTKDVLAAFPRGVWNIHASLLPKYRGASPIQSAILGGETHTGVTVMKTELALDTGDMLLVKRLEIGSSTYGELSERLSYLAAEAALEAVGYLEEGEQNLLMQDEAKATYCKKVTKADGKLDFNRAAEELVRLVKAYSPEPCAFCTLAGQSVNIFDAEVSGFTCDGKAGEVVRADRQGIVVKCGSGCISITQLQLAGGKRIAAADAVNGRKIKAGDVLE